MWRHSTFSQLSITLLLFQLGFITGPHGGLQDNDVFFFLLCALTCGGNEPCSYDKDDNNGHFHVDISTRVETTSTLRLILFKGITLF